MGCALGWNQSTETASVDDSLGSAAFRNQRRQNGGASADSDNANLRRVSLVMDGAISLIGCGNTATLTST